jgi:ribonuclease T1
MAERRLGSIATIAVVVVGLAVLAWWQRSHPDRPTTIAPSAVPPGPVTPSPTPIAPSALPSRPPSRSPDIADLDLSWIEDPDERAAVVQVATAIDRGGPFAYRRDGVVFENREQRLPAHDRCYWHEYTVPTPDDSDRGARRLVAGQQREIYYTRNHYRSFVAVRGGTGP